MLLIFTAVPCILILLRLLGTELPLVIESSGFLNDIFPFPSILDAGCPVFNYLDTIKVFYLPTDAQ